MGTIRRVLATMLLAAGALFTASALATGPIYHAHADTSAGTLTIDGHGFGAATGRAWLAATPLAIQSWTSTQIVATLPSGVAPGTYLITVQRAGFPGIPAFFVASIGTGAPDSSANGRIVGEVSACGAPIARTLVYIPGRSFVVFTDGSGVFAIENVPPGTYDVLIEAPGQAVMTRAAVVVSAGQTSNTGTSVVADLSSDRNNCGACGNVCLPGASCSAGQCSVPPVPQCTQDADCLPAQFCDANGTCQADLELFDACTRSAQCGDGSCEFGICHFPCGPGSRRCEAMNQCIPIFEQCP